MPYQAVIGRREAAAGELAIRERSGHQHNPEPIAAVLDRIKAEVDVLADRQAIANGAAAAS